MPCLGNFRLDFEKSILIFEISNFWFFQYAQFHAKTKILKFRTKFALFGLKFENTFSIFKISPLKIVLLQSLLQKYKCLNLCPKMTNLDIFGIEFKSNIIIFKKKHPSRLLDCKLLCQNKMPKFGIKSSLSGYLWIGIRKRYCHI